MRRLLLMVLALTLLSSIVSAADVDLYFFHGRGCPHCAAEEKFLEVMVEKYPLTVHAHEVYFDKDGRALFQKFADAYGQELGGVPTTFVGDKVIVGFNDAIGSTIEAEIKRCSEEGCPDPASKVPLEEDIISIQVDSSPTEEPGKTVMKKRLTIPAVVGAAAVDAINPCAFAVLIILLTTILVTHSKKKALFAGLAFSLSIFISYFLMGLGLFSAIQAAGVTRAFFWVVSVLAILIGLFNLKDYLWYGKWFIMEVPLSWRPKMKSLIKSVTSVPGAFLIGFVVSLFLLPCTSGPYIVILGMLAEVTTRNTAMWYLLLYNLIFVLPMLLITGAVSLGFTTTSKAEEWRQRKLKVLHFIAGVILLLLGIGMLIALIMGWV